MVHIRSEWTEHQCRRWMRPDAHRWIGPDAHRFLRPDYRRFLRPSVAPWPPLPLTEGKANFNPNQPRAPAGNPDGGQWTYESSWAGDGGTQAGQDEFSASGRTALARRGSRPHGHHTVPVAIYGGMKLPPETRMVFDEAKTGRLYGQTH